MSADRHAPNDADSTLGSGIESGIVVLIFAAAGYGLDRWLDTTPILTLVLFALGAVGLFYRYKAAYTTRMDAYETRRRETNDRRRQAAGPPPAPAPVEPEPAPDAPAGGDQA